MVHLSYKPLPSLSQENRKILPLINTSVQRCLYPLFQNQSPIFWCPLSSENYLNPQVSINNMVKKHTVDCHPSLSQFISRIQPLIFLWTPKGFIFPESFLNFFLNLYTPPWLQKSFYL